MSEKELIKQEIERRYNCEKCYPLDIEANVAAVVLEELLLFIDSLPEEPASEDLEEEIDKIWRTCDPIDEGMGVETANIHIEQFDDIARHFAEWQRHKDQQTIELAEEHALLAGRMQMEEEMLSKSEELKYLSDDLGHAYACGYRKAEIDMQDRVEKSLIEKSGGTVTIEDLVAYDQGFKTGKELTVRKFMDKLEGFFYENFYLHPHDCHVVQYESDTPLESEDDFVEQIRKYVDEHLV